MSKLPVVGVPMGVGVPVKILRHDKRNWRVVSVPKSAMPEPVARGGGVHGARRAPAGRRLRRRGEEVGGEGAPRLLHHEEALRGLPQLPGGAGRYHTAVVPNCAVLPPLVPSFPRSTFESLPLVFGREV